MGAMLTTLDDLSASLPNGFHDAELQRLEIDYMKREAKFIVDIWVGDMGTEQREVYRLAEVTLSGLLFWVSEPPDASYPYDVAGGERIDIGSLAALKERGNLKLPPIPNDAFENYIFLTEWNACHYIAAQDARLIWLGENTLREYA
jgi:hypothetical protein